MSYTLAELDLDLDIFQGPFDLLLNLILNEEIDLLDVGLAQVVIAYVDYLDQTGELDLEVTTEFLILVASLLELKSRLILYGEEEREGEGLEPVEAAEELVERMLQYKSVKGRAQWLKDRILEEAGYRFRDAPLPPELRRVSVEAAVKAYEPELLSSALGDLLREPPKIDLAHIRRPVVSLEKRLARLRSLLAAKGSFTFDEAVEGTDRLTEAVTLFALLELYKKGEVNWSQDEAFGSIQIRGGGTQ